MSKTTTKPAAKQAPPPAPVGAVIQDVRIENKAASVSDAAAAALAELARASAAHAESIRAIANALRGAGAHMHHGIHLSDVKGV